MWMRLCPKISLWVRGRLVTWAQIRSGGGCGEAEGKGVAKGVAKCQVLSSVWPRGPPPADV